MRAASPPSGLFFRHENAAFRRARGGALHGFDIGGTDLVIVMIIAMNICAENRALQGGRKHVGQQQIRHSLELVAGRRMSGNLNSQRAQLLYQAPHLGAAGTNLVGNLGAAHDHGGVVHQQAHNPPQTQVRPLRRGIVWPRATRPRNLAGISACGFFRNAENYAGEREKEQIGR